MSIAGHGNWSTTARLRPRYSSEATGERPSRLFLKIVRSDPDDEEAFGDSEVPYYTRDYLDVPDAPLVRCHDAAYSAADHCYHLLLDDVTATHVEATTVLPPWSTPSRWPTGSRRCMPAGGGPTG